MSYSTRCISRRSDLAVLACGVLVCSLALADSANPALNTASLGSTSEPDIEVVLPGARVVGQGLLRYWGIPIYHARLLAAPNWQLAYLGRAPLVLELTYQRAFSGADIARRSLQEMQRAGAITAEEEAAWMAAMLAIFPDVRAGDRISGFWQPEFGARFWWIGANGQRRWLGEIADARFAQLFFAIWLAPTTSEPGLRQALLGLEATRQNP